MGQPCLTSPMIIHIEAHEVRAGDIVLSGSTAGSNIVFGSTVARASEYDEMTYLEDTDGYSVPYDMGETVTVLRGTVLA
jgi:hypothetical protein